MSTPHFLDGDERLWQAIDGLDPVRDLHVTYLNLEPLSGKIYFWALLSDDREYFRDAHAGSQAYTDQLASVSIPLL